MIDFDSLYVFAKTRFSFGRDREYVNNSIHGIAHWKRVEKNGILLAKDSGGDEDVVRLFAIFHDCARENEGTDPDHGERGFEFATELIGQMFTITDEQCHLLKNACLGHTDGTITVDPTIGSCWDADRLDLGRPGVDVTPDPRFMSTRLGKKLALLGEIYG